MWHVLTRLVCDHTFNKWHVAERRLTSYLGTTIDQVQQRECDKCGYIQRASLGKGV